MTRDTTAAPVSQLSSWVHGPMDGEPHIWAKVLSRSPLVTLSATNRLCPAGIVSIAADIVGDQPALHLLQHTWTLERGHAPMIGDGLNWARGVLPNSEFLVLCANEMETLACASAGVPSILSNPVIMTDERVWYPRAAPSGRGRYDAAYVARLDYLKRHELAAGIEKLLLVYGYAIDEGAESALARVRRTLPNATFANHELGGGEFRMLDNSQVAELLAQSRVGLCLSAAEGSMRASMEYLLCGLPVVSTRSVGGRDRYYGTSYCRVVPENDAAAIAYAARELGELNLDRGRIRDHVGQILAFERYNFLLALNALVRRQFEVDYDIFPTITPFLGTGANHRRASEVRRMLKEQLETTDA